MGSSASNLVGDLFSSQEMHITILGVDGAGKTTILYKLKLNEVVDATPTSHFNVETVFYKNISFIIWDVGGRNVALRRHYYQRTQSLIFVVDSSDPSRIDEAARILHDELNCNELREVLVLVLANKQDLPNALSTSHLVNRMRLHQVRQQWHMQATCAATGDGLYEGLDWLASEIRNV